MLQKLTGSRQISHDPADDLQRRRSYIAPSFAPSHTFLLTVVGVANAPVKVAVAIGAAIGLFVTSAHAEMAEFTEAAIGCPSEDGMIAVYEAASKYPGDFKTVQAVVEHYGCEWIDKGVKLTLISQNELMSIVVRPHVFGKDVWYYVPTRSIKAGP